MHPLLIFIVTDDSVMSHYTVSPVFLLGCLHRFFVSERCVHSPLQLVVPCVSQSNQSVTSPTPSAILAASPASNASPAVLPATYASRSGSAPSLRRAFWGRRLFAFLCPAVTHHHTSSHFITHHHTSTHVVTHHHTHCNTLSHTS